MSGILTAIMYTIFTLALLIFLIVRLKIGRSRKFEGAGYIYSGSSLIFAGTILNLIQHLSGYEIWFIDSVYPIITILKAALFLLGATLYSTGLIMHFNFFGDRDIELGNHLEKIRLLDTIQQENRYPLPMLELLNKALKSLLAGLGEESGAVFLLNRNQRKFVLATGTGLTKDETALLEYYPYGRNLITRSIEDEIPMITGDFRSLGGKAQLAASRYKSILTVPIISGRSKLGALILFSTENDHYSRELISIITPITEWLAEKIEVNRLSRDLKKSHRSLESKNDQLSSFTSKLQKIVMFSDGIPEPDDFAERCVGLVDSDEVAIIGAGNGNFEIYGSSGGMTNFSDNFKSGLITAAGKNKAIILNQETTDETGAKIIAGSSLLLPIDLKSNLLLLRKSDGLIELSKEELQLLELVASLAGLVIHGSSMTHLSRSRSLGLKAISDTLKLKLSTKHFDRTVKSFVKLISNLLDDDSILLLLKRDNDALQLDYASELIENQEDFTIRLGESTIGRSAALKTESYLSGVEGVGENLSGLGDEAENILRNLFGERPIPSFQGDYPLLTNERAEYVISVFGFSSSDRKSREKHRILSLLTSLLNLRFEIATSRSITDLQVDGNKLGAFSLNLTNQINNDLSGVIGYCHLLKQDPNLSGENSKAIDSIIALIDNMTATVKSSGVIAEESAVEVVDRGDLAGLVKATFGKNSIYGNLYKVGDRALTVNLNLNDIPGCQIEPEIFENLFNLICLKFAAYIAENEILTVCLYENKGYVYIDFSKHRENFPPVSQVSGFGEFRPADQFDSTILENELKLILNRFNANVSIDMNNQTPSYFSIRFVPQGVSESDTTANVPGKALRVLAVDDQTVILDLLSAMCQSLGYTIYTARNGEEGIRLYEHHRPDLVISDLAMPGMSGWELATRVKNISPDTPVIIITGWGVSVDADQMKKIGVDHVLHKPFRLEQLTELISQIHFSTQK